MSRGPSKHRGRGWGPLAAFVPNGGRNRVRIGQRYRPYVVPRGKLGRGATLGRLTFLFASYGQTEILPVELIVIRSLGQARLLFGLQFKLGCCSPIACGSAKSFHDASCHMCVGKKRFWTRNRFYVG